MECPNCGEKIPEGKKFCGFCGVKLKAPSSKENDARPKPVITEQDNQEPVAPEPDKHTPAAPLKKRSHSKRKWLLWAIPIFFIVIGMALAVLFNWIPRQGIWGLFPKAQTPVEKTVVEEGLSINVAGEWVGEIGNEDWSATIEIAIDEYCEIGSICGTYRLLDYESRGKLELVEVLGFGYRFLEHPIEEENVSGPGYQTMNLTTFEDQKLNWSFRQELPSGDISIASGILEHK